MKVLIVDDNQSDRKLLTKLLSGRLGVEVLEAATGTQALKTAVESGPDLIISDILMPEMDAFAMLRELRQDERTKHITAIFYSAHYVSDKDEELAYKLGVSRFIVKPAEPAALVEEIQSVFDDHVAGRIKAAQPLLESEEDYLRRYSERVVRQLEKKVDELSDEVDERRRCELEARAGEERFKTIFDRSIVGIAEVDKSGGVIAANPSFKSMLGYPESETIDISLFDLVHPDELTRQRELWSELAERRTNAFRTESRYLRRDQDLVWLRESVSPIRHDDETEYVLLLAEDVTASKKAEEELKESQDHFLALFTDSFDGIFISEDEVILDANPASEEMFGYARDELIGMNMLNLAADADREMVADHIRSADRSRYECMGATKDGTVFDLEVSGQTRLYRGRPVRITTVRDVTERRRTGEALKQRDVGIRKAYVDVFSAVTGEKLVILLPDELNAALGEPVSEPFSITSFDRLAASRALLREVAEDRFTDLERAPQIILAAGEAITNAVKHGGGGEVAVYRQRDTIQVRVTDHGPGIDFKLLPRATLLQGFSTKQSLGIGFSVMLEVCDRVLLSTEPGNTTVILEIGKGEPAKSLDEILQSGLRSL